MEKLATFARGKPRKSVSIPCSWNGRTKPTSASERYSRCLIDYFVDSSFFRNSFADENSTSSSVQKQRRWCSIYLYRQAITTRGSRVTHDNHDNKVGGIGDAGDQVGYLGYANSTRIGDLEFQD